MSWKQLSQSSLADSLASHHKSLEELDDIHELLDWTRIEAHLKVYVVKSFWTTALIN